MVKTAKEAASNAKMIVNEFKNMSEPEKLAAYKEMICYLTDYNDEAISDSYGDKYGDPWQLIWVFDGDESTNVVCEGYSKAFQYLCEPVQVPICGILWNRMADITLRILQTVTRIQQERMAGFS